MKAIRLAFSLLMLPRLAARMVLFPVAIAGAALLVQLWLLSLEPRKINPAKEIAGLSVSREIAFGSSAPRPQIVRCQWTSKRGSPEFPPGKACFVEFHDVAIIGVPTAVEIPGRFEEEQLIALLNGNFDKVHYCESACAENAGIVIRRGTPDREITISGFSNLMLLKAAVSPHSENGLGIQALPGQKLFALPGLSRPISLTGLAKRIARLLGLIMLIVCCIWLSLRAHKRVLDYFASSGSLLPLAASAGPRTLYGALWVISGCRLIAFICLSVPFIMTFGLPLDTKDPAVNSATFWSQFAAPGIWLFAIVASLVLTTLCASVADLKKRLLSSILWRILPLVLVALGFLGWAITFLETSPTMVGIRNAIVATPLLGLAPVVVASIVEPPAILLLIHALLATALAVLVARRNARWFTTHLEDS